MIKNKEKVLSKIATTMKEEQLYIKKANSIDLKHNRMKINIEKFHALTELLKKEISMEESANTNLVISHNGNPYISYILAIKAIWNNCNLEICVNETMLGTNLTIIKIINEVLKEWNIKTKIEVTRKLDTQKAKNKKIIILQDQAEYARLKKQKVQNVFYIPQYSVALYTKGIEFEELKQDIIRYCFENLIEIEIYEAENIEDAIKQIEADNQGEMVMFLTKEKINTEKIEQLKKEKNIEIYLNQNSLGKLEEKLIRAKIR